MTLYGGRIFMRPFLIGLVALALSACAQRPTAEQIQNADYGTYPGDHEKIVKDYLERLLKDPESARYRFIKGPIRAYSSYFGPVQYGYGVCAEVNAKNSYGGYTGYKLHFFLMRYGTVVQHIHETNERYDIGGEQARQRCASI